MGGAGRVIERGSATLAGVGGLELYRRWWRGGRADSDPPTAMIVLVHGAGEHSGRYEHVAERLVADGYAVHALDHRGHGRSEGPRALIDRVDHAVTDLDALVSAAVQHESAATIPVLMVGHSMGAMIALRYALDHQHRLDGLAVSGALASIEAPAALRIVGHAISAIAPTLGLITIDSSLVSRDPAVVAAYRSDPLVHHGKLPARTAAEIADTVATFPGRVPEIKIPTLIMYGTEDRLCPPAGSEMLGERIGAAEKRVIPYQGLYHEIFNEPERDAVLSDLSEWLAARVAAARDPARSG
jgi:alpha-beta hydrolase superfamily lysophospholipase